MAAVARTKRPFYRCCSAFALIAAGLILPPVMTSKSVQAADPISSVIQELIGTSSPKPVTERMTRFELLVPSHVDFKVQALRSPTNRVIIEVPTTRLVMPSEKPEQHKGGLIKTFWGGISAPGQSRVVIEVTEPVVVQKQEIAKSEIGEAHRITLDLVPAAAVTRAAMARTSLFQTPPSALGAAGLQPPLPAPAVRPEKRIEKAYKPIIVIDPGHGGHDSGARKFGTVEKEVVLAFSKVLRTQIEATGRYKVLMTRETDEFISLDGRRDFAEKNNAALFIAVHADYASRTTARGATIYSLRENVADRLRSSAKQDVSDVSLSKSELHAARNTGTDGGMVRKILSDLAAREVDTTKQRTSMFSRAVVENLGSATSMRGQPHRSAAFRVLKTAKVPSVLIELAYVSNQRDAQLLQSDEWRQKVAATIRESIENYFAKAQHPAAIAASDN